MVPIRKKVGSSLKQESDTSLGNQQGVTCVARNWRLNVPLLSHGSYNTEWPSHFVPSKSAGKSCEKGKKCASQSQNKLLVRHLSRLTSWSLVVLRDVRMTMVPLACDCTVQACPAFCQVTSPKLSCNSFKKLSKFRTDPKKQSSPLQVDLKIGKQ